MTAKVVKQCKTCPWKAGCDPDADIPGYQRELHQRLDRTIRSGLESLKPVLTGGLVRSMACHYSTPKKTIHCAGWLHNQIGPGNNLGVRLRVLSGSMPVPRVVGEQRETFEETLPRDLQRKRK